MMAMVGVNVALFSNTCNVAFEQVLYTGFRKQFTCNLWADISGQVESINLYRKVQCDNKWHFPAWSSQSLTCDDLLVQNTFT